LLVHLVAPGDAATDLEAALTKALDETLMPSCFYNLGLCKVKSPWMIFFKSSIKYVQLRILQIMMIRRKKKRLSKKPGRIKNISARMARLCPNQIHRFIPL
jgi:hypothetical protein